MKGLDQALRQLAALPGQAENAARDSALAAAQAALRLSQALVPVRSGRLRASIAVRSLPDGASLTTDCPYAARVELGSRLSPAHPYLLPALWGASYPRLMFQALQEVLR